MLRALRHRRRQAVATGAPGIDFTPYDGLSLHVRRGMGERTGDRRFPGRPQPSGIEIERHAAYAPGDDLRHLDWNVYGRLDQLVVRRFTAEREVLFHILVDGSASMGVPARDRKFALACELANALAYVALSANDAVRLAVLPNAASRVYRQRASALRIGQELTAATPGGALALDRALEEYALHHPQPGAAIVISDLMMEPAEVERGVRALRARRYEVVLLHVVGTGELDPVREFGHGTLQDVESSATHPVVLTRTALARYQALLRDHLAALATLAGRLDATYARLTTERSVAEFVTTDLARLGLVRRR
ncbi:MAG TPA: DUF58 domain-containing protein [Candidatus Nitrosopolaris sp.]|nr:DUF58 domain-containing protein [Candidatus Nitrosopolaris sp.]